MTIRTKLIENTQIGWRYCYQYCELKIKSCAAMNTWGVDVDKKAKKKNRGSQPVSGFINRIARNKMILRSNASASNGNGQNRVRKFKLDPEIGDEVVETLDRMRLSGTPVVARQRRHSNWSFFCPIRARVTRIDDGDDERYVRVILFGNQNSRYFLLKSNRRFEEILARLNQARDDEQDLWIAVIDQQPDSDNHLGFTEIVDIVGAIAKRTRRSFCASDVQFDERLHEPIRVERANEIFESIERRSFRLGRRDDQGIPFLYVESGCIPRAHEMCRLIRLAGVLPSKLWVFERSNKLNFKFATINHPQLEVSWSFHVAPIVPTNDGLYVIDPAVATRALPISRWLDLFTDNNYRLYCTSDTIYTMTADQQTLTSDPDYSRTQGDLNSLRICFKLFAERFGRPPYV